MTVFLSNVDLKNCNVSPTMPAAFVRKLQLVAVQDAQ